MNGPTDAEWRRYAERLVDGLVRRGALRDDRWRAALLDVPRHHFVPAHYTRPARGGHWQPNDPGTEPEAPGWLGRVYSDAGLTIALSELDVWGDQHPVAASPPPELTVRSLQALGVDDGDRLLQLGVGCGYTTALAAHWLGPGRVVGVEIDPDLLRAAARRFEERDLDVAVRPGDGSLPVPLSGDGAPFDRVLVGYESDDVPAVWVHHVRPGGRLLARLTGGLGGGGHILFDRPSTDPGAPSAEPSLVGRFLAWTGPLPARRVAATRRAVRRPAGPTGGLVASGSTPVAPTLLANDDDPLVLLAQLHLPRGTTRAVRSTDTGAATYLQAPDGSWAEIAHASHRHGRHDTREAGPTPLVHALDAAGELYNDLGRPEWTDFGVTATAAGTHVWHHDPRTGPRWPLRTTWAANTGT
ncbi:MULTISPECIES: protein-L-isoaspartate O-methyltransferase family protein [Pseudonocardia]|uniref:L-isoaspartyl protein carboxyl methyltransferase n=1 Tax=Pseudonocardia abyssalis TaxID=2792008 RepID=A0ABS6V2B7_9PSEU|nr:methyltransferase domain-containing protein [Pseudonocardia abyssalis]MBW0113961.1 methyltransferase domain-containing protein [Pseudonocardia abyssalis]MBW0138416.1 methyltransferase domain-containing protein [Pseudonocardia abyssalis]